MWTCVAVDPGGTSGWCVLSVHDVAMRDPGYRVLENIARWSVGEITGGIGEQVDALIELIEAWTDADVVFEDFVLRTANSAREVLDPVRITHPVGWWLERGFKRADDPDLEARQLHLQQPSLAMTTVTDERLKAWGLYHLTAGKPHGRDALRHALTWARRRKAEALRAPTYEGMI
jgi:hypothetical protein